VSREAQGPVSAAELAAALREARVAKGLDLEEAARQAMLSEAQAAGLESGDHHTFYSPDYARRAMRRYAESLGVGHLVADLGTPAAAPPPPPGATAGAPPARQEVIPERLAVPVTPRRASTVNALLLVGAAAVTAIVWFAQPERASERPAPPPATAAVTAAPAAPPASAAAIPVAGTPAGVAAGPATHQPGATPSTPLETPVPAAPAGPIEPPPGAAPDAAPGPAGVLAEPVAQAPPRRSPRRLYVLAIRGTPLRIRDGTGRVLHDGVVGPGFSRSFEGEPPFSVEAASPDPLELYYLGRRVRLQDAGAERAAANFGAVPTPAQ
jgi:cytoskeleton protein RodZ